MQKTKLSIQSRKELELVILRSLLFENFSVSAAVEISRFLDEYRLLSNELEYKNKLLELKEKELKNFEEQKRRFILIANHELRTPASIISASLDALSLNFCEQNTIDEKLLLSAKKGSARLNETLEKFNLMLKGESCDERVFQEDINIFEMLHSLKARINSHLTKRNINFEINCPDYLLISGQKQKIFHLFDNLLSNAVKYSRDGGTILVKAVNVDEYTVISIQDFGIGIPEEELENIFKSFYQIGNPMNHHSSKYDFMGKGTGLGLPICKNIVEAHSGKIWAESEGMNSGCTIFIQFPLPYNEMQCGEINIQYADEYN